MIFRRRGIRKPNVQEVLDYSKLNGIQLFGIDMVNDTFNPVGGGSLLWFDGEEMVKPSGTIAHSRSFVRASDDLRTKVLLVGDAPLPSGDMATITRINDGSLGTKLRSPGNNVIRFKLEGLNESGNWRFPERAVIELDNSNQPEGVGFPSENPSYSGRPNYTPIYLAPNVMVGAGLIWAEEFSQFPPNLPALAPNTPDEYGVGINQFQFKRGLDEPIFPEPEQSPPYHQVITNDVDGDLAWQSRWYKYNGIDPAESNWRTYQKIDPTKGYLRVIFILGKSGSLYNKGTAYTWNLEMDSIQSLLDGIETMDRSEIPDPNDTVTEIHLDEYLEQGAGGAELDEIFSPPLVNLYAKAYQASSVRTEDLSVLNGGGNPQMTIHRHPNMDWFLFRNSTDFQTTASADSLYPKEFFRMLLVNYKSKLS